MSYVILDHYFTHVDKIGIFLNSKYVLHAFSILSISLYAPKTRCVFSAISSCILIGDEIIQCVQTDVMNEKQLLIDVSTMTYGINNAVTLISL